MTCNSEVVEVAEIIEEMFIILGQRMLKRCIAAGRSNVTNLKEGIPPHKLPIYCRPEAKKRKTK